MLSAIWFPDGAQCFKKLLPCNKKEPALRFGEIEKTSKNTSMQTSKHLSTFCSLFFCLVLMTPLFGQNTETSFLGQYENTQAQLSITVNPKGENYEGIVTFQGVQYPFVGSKALGMLNANYNFQGNIASFSISKLLGDYYFSADGVTIVIQKISDKATTPKASNPNTNHANNSGNTQVTATTQAPAATGQKVSDPSGGFSFQLPAGYQYAINQGGYSVSQPGNKIQFGVTPHHYNTLDQIKALAADVSDAKSNTYLKSNIQNYGSKGLIISMTGTSQGQPVTIALIALLSPNGGGVSIAGAGASADFTAEHTITLKSIANSVQFIKPQVSAEAQQWKQQLTGKRLTYLYTGSGYSEKKVIQLCSSGRYERYGDDSYLSNDAFSSFSAAGQNGNSGVWKVQSRGSQSFLTLVSDNGSTFEYSLAPKTSGQLLLNNKRYFIETVDCN